ncbi:MAG: LCP family protein [Chloroflexi bacterium]|nr:LCP family protein [Chloroflexota bacterium]
MTNVAREEVDRVFAGETNGAWVPPPTAKPTQDPLASATASPSPAPSSTVPRVNILLIGVDSGVGRNTANTDTMIVASLDLVTETVSIISIPRDMVNVPLPDGSAYAPKLNGLDSEARRRPSGFPGSDGSGHDVLMAAVGTLLKLKIDYYAAVNLPGFVAVVDTLGGVDVTVTRNLCDPGYTEYGFENGFSIKAGLRHLDGQEALAYARIRKAAGESDFTRAARQQEVISGLRDAIVKRGFLSDPVALLQALGRSISTNVPREILPDLADVMARVDRADTYRAVIRAPLVKPGFDARGSIQVPDIQGIAFLAARLFPEPGTLPDAAFAAPPPATTGSGSGTGNCVPAVRPAPSPTPAPGPTATTGPGPTVTTGPGPSASPEPTAEPSPSPAPESPEPSLSAAP